MNEDFSNVAQNSECVAEFLSIFASAKRVEILTILLNEEISVGRLAMRLSLSQSALSQHLALLRQRGIVSIRRESQQIFYRCDAVEILHVMHTLAQILPAIGHRELEAGNIG